MILIIIIIIITNSYIAHFTFHRFNALYISLLVIEPIASLNSFSAPWGVYNLSNRNAPKAFPYTISTSTLAGTHVPLGEEKQS